MLRLLLLLLVGAISAQESGDFAQEKSDQLIKVPSDEDENFDELFHDAYDEEGKDENGLSLNYARDLFPSQENDNTEPDLTEKAEGDVCPTKATCHYHLFFTRTTFFSAESVCRRKLGNLSSIHNWRTNNFLRRFMWRANTNSNFVWIGVWKSNRCRRYWNTDESRLGYTNWERGRHRFYGEWCVAMNVHTGKWWSMRCHTQLPFLCSYDD